MLTMKDLTSTKELDATEMKAVAGGMGREAAFSFLETIGYDYSEITNIQGSRTGQSNALSQSADVFSTVSGKGNLVIIKGGSNYAEQLNSALNANG
jgi:hypothetical protein